MVLRSALPCLLAAFALAAAAPAGAKDLREIVVSEPVHQLVYLPLYAAIDEGYFADEGLAVRMITISGTAPINAVLSKQAFAFMGGPEHNAYIKLKGGELRSVVEIVDRANTYLVARDGLAPNGTDYAGFVEGKRVATPVYGSTLNVIFRYLLHQWGVDPTDGVTQMETATGAIMATVASGQAQLGVISEPELSRGVAGKVWGEPFFDPPRALGPYAYTAINVRADSITAEPDLVEAFLRATIKGLRLVQNDPEKALAVGRKEFPTLPEAVMKTSIDRTRADQLWNTDGFLSPAAWETAKAAVMGAGMLKTDVPYDDIIDMRFVKKIAATK